MMYYLYASHGTKKVFRGSVCDAFRSAKKGLIPSHVIAHFYIDQLKVIPNNFQTTVFFNRK